MYRNRLITLSLLSIFYACSSQTPTSEPLPPAPAPEVSSSEIVAYLKQQIEVSPIASPNSKFHEQSITPEQIPAKQDELWTLWQEANKERLNESRLNVALSADYKQDFIWKIPQGQQLKSRIFTKGVAPQGGYPLIINLHGGGRNPGATEPWGWDLNQTEWIEQIKWSTGYYMDAPSLYFIPRMADDRIGRWYASPSITAFKRMIQLGWLSGLVNPDETYITGFSEGGYGSHRIALLMPDFFAGAGPMAAVEPLIAAENLRNIAFGFEIGQHDYAYNRIYNAWDWIDALEPLRERNPLDFVQQLNIQRDKGHGDINPDNMTTWLKKHKRRSQPERISYLYYNALRGSDLSEVAFSDGVYCLDFRGLKRSADDAQMSFYLERKGNTLHLTTKQVAGGAISGKLGIFLDNINWAEPVRILHNGREVYNQPVNPNLGAMTESLAMWGDPRRIFPAYVTLSL